MVQRGVFCKQDTIQKRHDVDPLMGCTCSGDKQATGRHAVLPDGSLRFGQQEDEAGMPTGCGRPALPHMHPINDQTAGLVNEFHGSSCRQAALTGAMPKTNDLDLALDIVWRTNSTAPMKDSAPEHR